MSGLSCGADFDVACRDAAPQKANTRSSMLPLSVRFTKEERERLNKAAGKQSLSAYIRMKVLGDAAASRKALYMRKQRKPSMDAAEIAKLLGLLGQSELGPSMIAIAYAARSGSMPVTPELLEKLDQACGDISAMRSCLIVALGIKPQGGDRP